MTLTVDLTAEERIVLRRALELARADIEAMDDGESPHIAPRRRRLAIRTIDRIVQEL